MRRPHVSTLPKNWRLFVSRILFSDAEKDKVRVQGNIIGALKEDAGDLSASEAR